MVGVSVVVQGNEIKGVRNRCDTARQGDQRRVLVVGAQVLDDCLGLSLVSMVTRG